MRVHAMCLRCLILTLSGPVELLFLICLLDLCCGEYYAGCLEFECFPIYVSVCFVSNWSNQVAVTDWGGANSRFLGLVSVGPARSLDQTALRPPVIQRIRQMTLNT